MENDLNHLQHLFRHIPQLSSPPKGSLLPLNDNFMLDPEKVELYGSELDALNQALGVSFSDWTRYEVTLDDGTVDYHNHIKFTDRNSMTLVALVGIMEKFFTHDRVRLEIWVGNLMRSVYTVYEEVGIVSTHMQILEWVQYSPRREMACSLHHGAMAPI